MKSSRIDGDLHASLVAGQTLRTLLLARLYTYKYLMSNKQTLAIRVNKEFSLLEKNLKDLEIEIQDEGGIVELKNAINLIIKYKQGVKDIVEIIKKRNYLIDNKLHKIGIHIQYLAEKIKLSVKKDQDRIGPELLEIFKNVKIILIIMSFIMIFITLLVIYFVPKQLINPLKFLNKAILNLINSNEVFTKLPITSKDEIALVCTTFNKYLEQKDNVIKSREELLRNISHELKTPISKGKFIIEKLENTSIDSNIVNDLQGIFLEMDRLLSILIEMEKLKNTQILKESLSITDIILDSLSKLYIEDESIIKVDIKDDFIINANKTYIVLAIKNLIDNAIKYAINYPIEINFLNNSIQIINDGNELLNPLSYYLQPFYRDKNSLTQSGHGLGLSFVTKILEIHKYKLTYTYKNIFCIEFCQ